MESIAGLHPLVVHFPIALLLLYTLFETTGVILKNETLTKAAFLILILGVVSAIAAVLTGGQAEEIATHLRDKGIAFSQEVLETHEKFATISVWYFFAILGLRTYFIVQKKFVGYIKIIFVVLALIGAYFILETGEHGGELVFKYGVGTDIIQQNIVD